MTDDELYSRLAARVAEAERKHPAFSDGIYQGIGVLGEEYGEMCRITGYLVGTLDRFNDAKRAEEADRVKHGMGKSGRQGQ